MSPSILDIEPFSMLLSQVEMTDASYCHPGAMLQHLTADGRQELSDNIVAEEEQDTTSRAT
ncbi:MAG: hypothetical protein FRX49_07588 [Trebouxia sp. A1-2]|nr:MAG: hypothetical protein FRX49_07588 [Trebouxia sp. A1-2]